MRLSVASLLVASRIVLMQVFFGFLQVLIELNIQKNNLWGIRYEGPRPQARDATNTDL